jgi:quercetin dioxygenase-like cupin family protein
MELSERCIETLEKEGFRYVYEWQDKPGTVYPEHSHRDKVAIFITEGLVDLTIAGTTRTLRTGDRFDVPPGVPHTAKVGPYGCQYVVGEMVEGDS